MNSAKGSLLWAVFKLDDHVRKKEEQSCWFPVDADDNAGPRRQVRSKL